MERKTVHALLLSLAVVAGGVMMTTDAHAQTNTERLMTTVDNTNSILAALQSLADAVADGFASVLAAIGMVQTGVDNMSGHLEHLESDVAGISSDVSSVDSSVAAVSSDVASIADDVADVSSSLQSVQNDLAGLSAGLAGSTAAFSSISEQVSANQVAINDLSAKLDMISEAVGAVQTTVETQEDVDPAVSNMLHTAETEQSVAVADFAGDVTKHPTDHVYEASNTFSCTGDVFVDTLSVAVPSGSILESNADTAAPTAKSTITVEGFFLYEATDVGVDTTVDNVEITKTRDFDNRFLRAGDGLVVKGSTDQSRALDNSDNSVEPPADRTADDFDLLNYNNGTTGAPEFYFSIQDYVALQSNKATIGPGYTQAEANTNPNATKTNLGTVELYTITVGWFAASSDTTCSISSAVETVSGLPNADRTVLVALNIDTDSTEGPPTPFLDATLDCNGEDTEITNISIQAGAIAGLNQFIEVELSAGGEPASVSFGTDNRADSDASDLPFRFSGSDLTVSGEGIGTLLLQLTYDTTQGNTCK